jgi:transposase
VTGIRCGGCGNKTRFDVLETKRVRSFHHYTLGGELTIEDEELIDRTVEQIVCRWCGRSDAIEQPGDQAPVHRGRP